jgi:hypothetical protein
MAPRITSSRNRSTRSASRRATSSKNRAQRQRASTNSNRVTSDNLRNELKNVKRRRSNTTSSRNRSVRSRQSTATTTQGRGVDTRPGNARGTQGPGRAPVQGPSTPPNQGPSRATRGGLIGSRQPTQRTTSQAPRVKGTPGVAGGSGSLRVRNRIQPVSKALRVASAVARANPYIATGEIIAHDIMNRGVADGTLKGKPVAKKQGPPAPKAKGKSESAIKPPTKKPAKNKAVLAKKKGKTGSMVNGVFFPHQWSSQQRMRYAARGGK